MALGGVHPSGLTPTRLRELLRRAGIQQRRRTIPKSTCGTVLRQLRAGGIACSTSARDQTAVLDSRAVWRPEQALRNNRLHRFQRALVPDLPTYGAYDVGCDGRQMKLRNYAVAGRFDWIEPELGSVKMERRRESGPGRARRRPRAVRPVPPGRGTGCGSVDARVRI